MDNDDQKDKIIKTYNIKENCTNLVTCPFYWCGGCCISVFFIPYIIYINTKKY